MRDEPDAAGHPTEWETLFAPRAANMQASEIRELLKLLGRPDIISFAGGIPDPALFPLAALATAHADILGDPASARTALQYSVSEGYAPLREWIVARMARLGVPCGVDNVVITAGSQQALDFVGKLLLGKGDTALVERPTYLGALQAFNAYEPRYDNLALAGGNRTPGAYRDAAQAAGSRLALAYVVPDFANPTGVTLSLEARHRLLDLTDALGIPLVEDAAYEALRYEGERLPSCLALAIERQGHIDRTRVVYCGTFSKTIAPGLRLGWICAAAELVQKIVLAKQAGDLHSATLSQMAMHRVAAETFDSQIARITAAYARRRDAMLAALARHMPDGVAWSKPAGGMFVWVTLPPACDGAALLRLALDAGVAFVPGQAFFYDGEGANTIRLSFSQASEAAIDEGIARLARVIVRCVEPG